MRLGYKIRSSGTMLRHPFEGAERVRGRIDRRRDLAELAALGDSTAEDSTHEESVLENSAAGDALSKRYPVTEDWAALLHKAINVPWPCQEPERFGEVWDATVADLAAAGLRVGRASYGGWSDGDRAHAEAIWCLVAHLRPGVVVETGVAHGLTSRVILEGLHRNGRGHLWSIDLPAVDPALHHEIGIAVPQRLRSGWTYVEGTSRYRLPPLVRELKRVDLFVHDSLHTARNMCFELGTVWPALPAGGVAVVDDIDHSLGFRRFVDRVTPGAWMAARHVTGSGLWGTAVKGESRAEASPGRAGWLSPGATQVVRKQRHERIKASVVREIARMITAQARDKSRLLQIQPGPGRSTLVFREQLAQPGRPVIFDSEDNRDPVVRSETDFYRIDIETDAFPADNGAFDVAVWNRDLVTVRNLGPALREARRVLRPGGVLVLAVPNLAALHNRLLLMTGRQPTTLHIGNGDHVRGIAFHAMTEFLSRDLDFQVLQVAGVGLAPVTAAVVPGPLRGLSHTVVWALRKPERVTRREALVPAGVA